MATAAQVRANRANAQKSTGPRTPEGKERASRNAVQHGLLAREAVIQGEDPEEFEVYRTGMLEDLAPAGPVERMLAERIVGLSWRLRRAERLQNEAFAALDDGTPTPLLDARLDEWKRLKGSKADQGVCGVAEEDHALGRVVVEDFTRARVLDRLLLYERRIESSLYRTMAELRRVRAEGQASAAATPEEVPRSECRLAAGEESVAATKLGSFGANAVAGGQMRQVAFGRAQLPADAAGGTGLPPMICRAGSALPHGRDARDTHGQDAHATETPYGVTTNRPAAPNEAKRRQPVGASQESVGEAIVRNKPNSGGSNLSKQTQFAGRGTERSSG